MNSKTLVCALHPRHAENLFSGRKLYEIRRTRPNISEGDLVLVYVTSPVQKYMGYFVAGKILSGSSSNIWSKVGNLACISKRQMLDYLAGKDTGYAIQVCNPTLLAEPIGWKDAQAGGFTELTPPQGFKYISEARLRTFINFRLIVAGV